MPNRLSTAVTNELPLGKGKRFLTINRYADLVLGAVDAPFARRIDGWINPAAFTQAPQFTFGNLSRTIGLRGPGTISWDVSVFKSFQVPKGIKAQFRAEALNVTNTPQFNGPNTTFTSAAFGLITSQANYPRLIQLGVRFTR